MTMVIRFARRLLARCRMLTTPAPIAAVMLLAACTGSPVVSFESEASSVLADLKVVSPLFGATGTLIVDSLSGVLNVAEASSGAVTSSALTGLDHAVKDLAAAYPSNPTIAIYAAAAESAIATVQLNSSASTLKQVFTDTAAVALEAAQLQQSQTVRGAGAVSVGQIQVAIADGKIRLGKLEEMPR